MGDLPINAKAFICLPLLQFDARMLRQGAAGVPRTTEHPVWSGRTPSHLML